LKTFRCDRCANLLFFENVKCLKCGATLGFLPESNTLAAIEPLQNGHWRAPSSSDPKKEFRLCENSRLHEICNWMTPADDPDSFCASCRLNILIPDLSAPGNLERWHKLENAKRRILYTVLRLHLPVQGIPEENRPPLRFKFAADLPGQPVTTGHADGAITINIAEADDAERERRRVNLHEPYRTLLGHVRHEIAHYYWDRLIARTTWQKPFRALFGDETADYSAALQRHYAQGPPPDWPERHVSAYASSHPWEDWAETWAHYFHIIDMVETAESFGLSLRVKLADAPATAKPRSGYDPDTDFDTLLQHWFPLTYALNSLNRGMGLLDAYPFVLSPRAIEKLRFIHDVTHSLHLR